MVDHYNHPSCVLCYVHALMNVVILYCRGGSLAGAYLSFLNDAVAKA